MGPLAQFGMALGLIVLEVALTAAALLVWFFAALHLDTGTPAPEVSPAPYLLAVVAIGVGAGAAAVTWGGRRAWGVAVTQGLMAALLTCGALAGLAYEARDAAPEQPAPAPGVVGCRSGDHSQECAHLGG
ncbi:hypothetical protein EES44_26505 [Streptomyces sp. ADI96-15]|nr:Hypothetical protein B591_12508 [Streptomyces sp. GBA 94-10 4N24]ESQ04805.1 Hypothetical protein B590_12643 [Streptomyces sp. PVA_94-07]RPK56748.1 hypothetical protein EES44_26505 [Streptomyces sp. ADI96-15]UZN59488.1 Hypothetical protein B591N_12508 [Streptomyces sp. GBA 94-10 4N24]